MNGQFRAEDCRRLAEAVAQVATPVQVEIKAFVDENGRTRLTGSVQTCVDLICQRCLEPVEQPLKSEFDLLVFAPGRAPENLPRDVDWIEVELDDTDILELVEDELILALPTVPKHDNCGGDRAFGIESGEDGEAQADTDGLTQDSPFSVLKQLKD
ncbi:MAG: YceD family protein [bacterium]